MRKLYLNAAILAALFFCRAAFAHTIPASRAGIVCKAKKAPPLAVNLYGAASYCAPKNMEGDIPADSSYAFAYGFKLGYGALDARLFNSCSKTGGADFWSVKSFGGYEEIFKNRRWSVSLDLSKFSGELGGTVALGSLKFYSQKRLAPFSAALSPFAASVGDAGQLKVSLPTKSSSARDDAIFAGVSFKALEKFSTDKIRLMPLRAEFGISENESDPAKAPFLAGLEGGFFYLNFFKLTAGLLFRRSYFEEKSVADVDWIEEIPVWKSEFLNAASADLALEIPHLKSRTTFAIAESPKSLGRWTLAQEFLASAGAFSVSAALFASDNLFESAKTPYVAANSTECKNNWQAKIAPQLDFNLSGGRRLKIGAAGLLEERLVDFGKKTEHNSLEARFAAGLQIAGKANAFRLVGTSGAAVLRQTPAQETVTPLPKASATAVFSHNFAGGKGGGNVGEPGGGSSGRGAGWSGGRLVVSAGASFQPEFYWEKREWTERLKIAFYPRAAFLSGAWISCQASQKNGAYKITPAASASFLLKLRAVRLNASLSAEFPFSL